MKIDDLTRIENTDLSVRTKNVLGKAGYTTVKRILCLTEYDLRKINNLGEKSVAEVLTFIEEYNNCSVFDTDSDDGFLQWVKSNRDIVKEYIKSNDVPIKDIRLETRTYNALRINDIRLLSEFALENLTELDKLNMLDRNARFEIKAYVNEYLLSRKKEILAYDEKKNNESHHQVYTSEAEKAADVLYLKNTDMKQIKSLLKNDEGKRKIIEIIKDNDVRIENFDLSVRLYNCLKRHGVNTFSEMISLYPDGFSMVRNLGSKAAAEACEVVERNILIFFNNTFDESIKIGTDDKIEKELSEMSVEEMLDLSQYRDLVLEYIKANDIDINLLALSARSEHALLNSGMNNLSAFLQKYPDLLYRLKGLGKKSIDEIQEKINSYLAKIQPSVAEYCSGNTKALYSDEWIEIAVMRCFSVIGFKGLSYSEIRQNLPDDIEDARIKKSIGKLIAEKKLEYVDFRCYKIYPSFIDTIYSLKLDDKVKDMLIKRLNGITLEEVAVEYGLTRERVRQICSKNFTRVKTAVYNATGSDLFDEDYYDYLYSKQKIYLSSSA